jgi:hypothetical protein
MVDTGLDEKELISLKSELESKKRAFFYNDWVFIPNLDKHNPYWKSPKTKLAYEEELKNIPKEILDYFNNKSDSTIYSTMDTISIVPLKHKTENINNKSENINNKEERVVKREEEKNLKISLKSLTSNVGISKQWQDTAFRYAFYLKIDLSEPKLKARWLKFFKENVGKKSVSLALSYLADYPPFTSLKSAENKIKYFFAYCYNNDKDTVGGTVGGRVEIKS